MLRQQDYPLTVSGPLVGLVAACLAGLLADSLVAAYAVLTLFVGVGLFWRKADPAVLPFIFAYQWVSVTAGFWYEWWFGRFPGYYAPGDVEHTMFLALSGLLVLAFGARVVSQWIGSRTEGAGGRRGAAGSVADDRVAAVWPLFVAVMISYGVDYALTINAREFGSISSLIQRVLEFRQVLLVTLWMEIIRSRKHGALLVVSFVWALMPNLGAYYSDFKGPVVLLLIVLAAQWRPWEAVWWRGSLLAALKAVPLTAALLVLLLVWQGGLKRSTRLAHDEGMIGADPAERITFFISSFRSELPQLFEDPEPYVEALVERISYITFFSRVIEHVPSREPYADGELLRMAFLNAFVPRFLVPDKAELPSDSYYTRRFTGIQVAEDGTSISIGYMAEFYADWGLAGMFTSVLAYGCWIGLIAGVVRRLAAVPAMRFGALTMTLLAVADFEHQFIKGFASLNLNAAVTLFLLFVLGPQLRRLIGAESAPIRRQAPSGPEGVSPL